MLTKLPNTEDTGILSIDEIKKLPGYPGDDRIEKGPVVVIECGQDIPCNPCEDICPEGAISVGDPITNLPAVNPDVCNGCIICISICPGLCMFVVHKNFNETEALIYLPYELLPLPEKGSIVKGCNRKGEPVCDARVEKVLKGEKLRRTAIIAIAVPKELFETVRGISI